MTLSVALCTYQGAAFLTEQLESLLCQTRLPDELVVCDDVSTDGTLSILHEFAVRAPFPVHVHVNARNLGSSANFAQVVAMCRGDLIALADQDDIWMSDKLAMLESCLQASDAFAFSDAALIDAHGQLLPSSLWRNVGLSGAVRRRFFDNNSFRALLQENRVTGATMLFRARYRDFLLPVPSGWVHDAWFALALSACADCRPVPHPLINYRLHAGQQIGARRHNYWQQYQSARKMGVERFNQILAGLETLRNRLADRSDIRPQNRQALDEAIAHWTARFRMRQNNRPRLPAILNEACRGRYQRYSRGWKSLAQDLVM